MTLVAGADLAKGQWAVVVLADGRFRRALRAASLIQLQPQARGFALLGVDIPIGLPQAGTDWPRPADLEARALLGRRRATIFLTPPRPVVLCQDYAAANRRHFELTDKGLSRQTWGLRDGIFQAADLTDRGAALVEVHPELSFRAMKGAPVLAPKKSWNGQMERRALLRAQGIELPDELCDAGLAAADDILDAAAAAWSAWRVARGAAEIVPAEAAGCGVEQRGVIWY
jgi:predicted RNase H-like nuclease